MFGFALFDLFLFYVDLGLLLFFSMVKPSRPLLSRCSGAQSSPLRACLFFVCVCVMVTVGFSLCFLQACAGVFFRVLSSLFHSVYLLSSVYTTSAVVPIPSCCADVLVVW